jgi:hypothetical protein
MAYIINRFDGTQLTIIDDGILDTSTPVGLIGRNYTGYGEVQNENFIWILENFANTSPPTRALSGQAWYDKGAKTLKVFNGTNWLSIGNSTVSEAEPDHSNGGLWLRSTTNQLYVSDGTTWRLVGPEGAEGFAVTKMTSLVVKDNTGISRPIIISQINGETTSIYANDEFTLGGDNLIGGFSTLKKGLNIKESHSFVGPLTGNADTATALETAIKINTVLFDGTSDITINASTYNSLIPGDYILGNNFNGSFADTWDINASSENQAGTVVARDSTGGFSATIVNADIFGNVTGNVTAASGISTFDKIVVTSISGQTFSGLSATASRLSPGRRINTVPFDGTEDITLPVPAETLTGNTLAPNIVDSSLTSLGKLTSLNVEAPGITVGDGNNLNIYIEGFTPTIESDTTNILKLKLQTGAVYARTPTTVTFVSASAAAADGVTNPAFVPDYTLSTDIEQRPVLGLPSYRWKNIYSKTATLDGLITNTISGRTTADQVTFTKDIVVTGTAYSSVRGNVVGNLTGTVTGASSLNVLKTGDTMSGDIAWLTTGRGIEWRMNTDGASIRFYNTGDGDTNSRLEFNTFDNGNEYFRWTHTTVSTTYESMKLVPNGTGSALLSVSGSITSTGNITGTHIGDGSQLTNLNASNLATGILPSARLSGYYNINVTGNVSGNVTGNLQGNVSGNLTGSVIGNVTGYSSLNVLKSGDTMTGDLNIIKDNAWLTLDSPSIGTDGQYQAAGISIGESGYKGSATLHFTYTGDGYGHIGMGPVNTASSLPQFEAIRLYYLDNTVRILGNMTVGGTASGTFTGTGTGLTLDAGNIVSGYVPQARLSGTYNIAVTGNSDTATRFINTRTINGVGFDGTSNINVSEYIHSNRDFSVGTLITTNINYANSEGEPWVLEIKGNSYGSLIPWDITYQGYIYSGTIINHGGISNGTNLTGMVAVNSGGVLCFWFPRQAYWQGFNVKVYVPYATVAANRVTTIIDSGQPGSAKLVNLSANIRQSLHSSNFNSYVPTLTGTGASGIWPISIGGNANTVTTLNSSQISTALGYTPVNPGNLTNQAGTAINGTTGTFSGRINQSISGIHAANIENISTRTNSGFYDTSTPTVAEGWPVNGSWHHLISSTHINDDNYYAMQFSGDFYDSNNVYYRATAGNGNTGWNKLLHSGNYNTYAPTLTGGNASGTWNINIGGNANSASSVTWNGVSGKPTNFVYNDGSQYGINISGTAVYATIATQISNRGNVTAESNGTAEPANQLTLRNVYSNGYPTSYGNLLTLGGSGGGELLVGWSGSTGAHADNYVRSRRDTGNIWSAWAKLITDVNYNSYAPSLTGAGATGTNWAISITGNSNTVTTLNRNQIVSALGYTPVNPSTLTNTSGTAADFSSGSFTGDVTIRKSVPTIFFNDTGDSGIELAIRVNSSEGLVIYEPEESQGFPGYEWFRIDDNSNAGYLWESQILTAANYTSFAPGKTGSGASGTWPISINGQANTVAAISRDHVINALGYTPANVATLTNQAGSAGNFSSVTATTGNFTTLNFTGALVTGVGNLTPNQDLVDDNTVNLSDAIDYTKLEGGTLSWANYAWIKGNWGSTWGQAGLFIVEGNANKALRETVGIPLTDNGDSILLGNLTSTGLYYNGIFISENGIKIKGKNISIEGEVGGQQIYFNQTIRANVQGNLIGNADTVTTVTKAQVVAALGYTPATEAAAARITTSPLEASTATFSGAITVAKGANLGIRWPNDAYGGGGDTARITLESAGGEATRMTFTVTNDADDQFEFWAPSYNGLKMNGYTVHHDFNTMFVSSAAYTSSGFTNQVGSFNYNANYFDVYPPAGYTMAHIVAFIPSIHVIHFAGGVNGDDSLMNTYEYYSDRIRVRVQNTEQRSTPAANYLAIWRR